MPPLVSQTPRSPSTPLSSHQRVQSSNSGYFGLKVNSGDGMNRSVGSRSRNNFPSSGFEAPLSAISPHPKAPVETNPEFEDFRSQVEKNARGSTINAGQRSPSANGDVLRHGRPHSGRTTSVTKRDPPSQTPMLSLPSKQAEAAIDSDRAQHSRSPKRLLSYDSANAPPEPRRQSPAQLHQSTSSRSLGSPPRRREEKHPRLSDSSKEPKKLSLGRAETLPDHLEHPGPSLVTPQHVCNIIESGMGDVLLLDLRVSTQYVKARISGAMNLCIPTTLLKRPSYNVSRLADTIKDEGQRAKFENWQGCRSIVVYDNASSQFKEASNCLNVLRKFASEGWSGESCVIRGGFVSFAQTFPRLIDRSSHSNGESYSSNADTESDTADVPPVIGGCPMPATKNAANPFFGNIRQNMDLIGGVGQLPIHCPDSMSKRVRYDLPTWLRQATDDRDHGKTVSNKFLQIEKREQKRMQEALSENVVYSSGRHSEVHNKVEITGIEKGAKNRYNNIWPFDHSRVRLKGVPGGECDYVNANHVFASVSKRRYIATQAPIPATFTDFWKMIWQRDVRLVVMLTAEAEGGQVKAHNYWEGKRYGSIKINHHDEQRASLEAVKLHGHRSRDEQRPRSSSHHDKVVTGLGGTSPTSRDHPHVIVRKFTISNDDEPFERMREITQLQYTSWPDFGAPAHPAHLLGLVEQCDSIRRTQPLHSDGNGDLSERPVLVHCSAGCGRTGTFCTIDTVVDMLRQQQQYQLQLRTARNQRHTSPMDLDSKDWREDRGHENFFFANSVPTASSRDKQNRLFDGKSDGGDWLTRDDVDLVEKTVEEFRLQRLSMVQTLRQFVLCYETVLEWVANQGQPKTT